MRRDTGTNEREAEGQIVGDRAVPALGVSSMPRCVFSPADDGQPFSLLCTVSSPFRSHPCPRPHRVVAEPQARA